MGDGITAPPETSFRCGILAPGRNADLVILRPGGRYDDPHEAAVDPATRIAATLRRGRVVAGTW